MVLLTNAVNANSSTSARLLTSTNVNDLSFIELTGIKAIVQDNIIDDNYKSLIFKSMIHEILISNVKNLKWSVSCIKRLRWRLFSILDLISMTYSYTLKLLSKIK